MARSFIPRRRFAERDLVLARARQAAAERTYEENVAMSVLLDPAVDPLSEPAAAAHATLLGRNPFEPVDDMTCRTAATIVDLMQLDAEVRGYRL